MSDNLNLNDAVDCAPITDGPVADRADAVVAAKPVKAAPQPAPADKYRPYRLGQ